MKYTLIPLLLLLTGCDAPPDDAYGNPGDPRRQLLQSAEIVSFDLERADALDDLSSKLSTRKASYAVARCDRDNKSCRKAVNIARIFNVPVRDAADVGSMELVYEALVIDACDPRYRDNSKNGQNLNHSAFGCATRSNMVHMGRNLKQFTQPEPAGMMDGEKAASAYDRYLNPPPSTAGSGESNTLIPSATTQ